MSRRKTILTAVVLILIMLIGGMLAFFTDADEDNKVFVLGNIKIKFSDESVENFDVEINKLTPNKTIDQKAELENVGENDAYIFVKVKMPHINVSVDGDEAKKTDLFTTNMNKEKWMELTQFNSEEVNFYTHVYAYVNGSKLAKFEAKTEQLTPKAEIFSQISFINISNPTQITDVFKEGKLQVDVTAYAIQADDIDNDPASVWTHLEKNLVQ